MEMYVVGGAVRDVLMDRTPKDIDYVVVGSTPEEMISRGFVQVGASFPVFLKNGEEYALARQERKTGVGYNGFETRFDPSVTLEDDLMRRDLTINSMAVKQEDWEEFVQTKNRKMVIDPFCGITALECGVLHHTSEAFAEDPIRVLRTARFAARYGFTVHPITICLMQQVVQELDHVPHERIWAEFAKGLMEDAPHCMISVLREVGAFAINALFPYRQAFPYIVNRVSDNIAVRFASIGFGFTEADYEECRIPIECSRLSTIVNKFGSFIRVYEEQSADDRLTFLMEIRAFNSDLEPIYEIIDWIYGYDTVTAIQRDINAAKTVDTATIASQYTTGSEIKNAIFIARIRAMTQQETI